MSDRTMVVYPYWNYSTWVFDDKERGLVKEAFVMGADDILTEALVLRGIGLAETKDGGGFKCTFSDEPLEGGFTAKLLGPRDLTYEMAGDWDWGDLLDGAYDEDIPEMGAKEMKEMKLLPKPTVVTEREAEAFLDYAYAEGEKPISDLDYEELNPAWLPSTMQPRTTSTQMVVMGLQGNDYQVEETGSVGWLCPALLKFYDEAPETLYFAVERLPLDEEDAS